MSDVATMFVANDSAQLVCCILDPITSITSTSPYASLIRRPQAVITTATE